jgi:hypothetical protein
LLRGDCWMGWHLFVFVSFDMWIAWTKKLNVLLKLLYTQIQSTMDCNSGLHDTFSNVHWFQWEL